MILRLLRQFAAFRKLELDLQRELLSALHARAEVDEWKERCIALEQKADRLAEQLVTEAHKVTDVFASHSIGRRVYTKADPPPFVPLPASTPLATGRMFARAAQATQTQQTEGELKKIWDAIN